MVTEVLEAIADEIVHQCDSVVITEVITPNSFEHRSLDGEGCDDQCICSAQCFCAREIEHFSNIAVDFEASFDPSLVYFLDLESILAVEAVILQWHTQVQNVYTKSFREQMARIYRECKNPFFNNAVLAHEFLNNYEFSQILAYTTRFIDKNPPNFVQNLIIFRKN
ncbi:hypothetical protein WA026_000047 [Henosepilachna vigintioctopunctata]|uniref:Uncharacterized protein n=1 Tax=Henosepilachna vigintioctopunctata TaxID=420089 RepID=A0AAW1V757_9CUCU